MKVKRYILLFVMVIIGLVLESTTFTYFTVFGVQPDLVLLMVIYFALFSGSRKGAFFGFLCGIAQDLMVGQYIGLNAITKAITAYLVGLVETKVYKEYLIIPLVIVLAASLTNEILFYLISSIFEHEIPAVVAFKDLIIPGAIYNGVVAIFTYSPFQKSITKGHLAPERY